MHRALRAGIQPRVVRSKIKKPSSLIQRRVHLANTGRRNRHLLQRQLLRQNQRKLRRLHPRRRRANQNARKRLLLQHRSESPSATETPSASPAESPEAGRGKKGWPNVSLSPDAIEGYEKDPPKVRQILDAGLALTKQNLGYTYGSADPANGGMDCSGFIYYVLKQNGFPDVPRDSSQQYVWVRKAGNLYAVLSRKEDSFEFDDLKPGDLLFWRGTYNIDRDPPITHTMIYLGREKRTNKRVMVGSSDGRTYDGKQRWGVSVFDFKMPPPPKSGDAKISPVFVGYGRIPGLPAQ